MVSVWRIDWKDARINERNKIEKSKAKSIGLGLEECQLLMARERG